MSVQERKYLAISFFWRGGEEKKILCDREEKTCPQKQIKNKNKAIKLGCICFLLKHISFREEMASDSEE